MKVLIVSATDTIGGAARAAYRLHSELLASGVNSQMLVLARHSDDHSVLGARSKMQALFRGCLPTFDQLPVRLYGNRERTLFSAAWFRFSGIPKIINELNPDIVHLHWICGGMLAIDDIARIKAPFVWSLHDNWPFTGGCHIMWDCTRYLERCGCCPILGSHIDFDLSRIIYQNKKRAYAKVENLTLVGLSNWIVKCAKNSSLFKNIPAIRIPNLINTATFSPVSQAVARELMQLPPDKKILVFGAVKATSDINKGFKQLCEALDYLERDDVELVVFGSGEPAGKPVFRFKTRYIGCVADDLTLRVLYSAANCVIVPSLQENLSNIIMESLACGTPVAAFDVGGNSDLIDHRVNGYLAKPFASNDLAEGINWILDTSDSAQLALNARAKIIREFASDVVVKKYVELYRQVLGNYSTSG